MRNVDANTLVLTALEVPRGFKLRDSEGDPTKAHRAYGKGRFMKFGDAIWSEATVMGDAVTARSAWEALVEFHKERAEYDNVQELVAVLGDDSYVHAGTMGGREGLWAAVRIGPVIHRFNTYGVTESNSLQLLRRQLAKTPTAEEMGPVREAVPQGARDGAMATAASLYSPAEWRTLLITPFWVVVSVGLADGSVQDSEIDALFRHMIHAAEARSRIGREILSDLAENFESRQDEFVSDPRHPVAGLREAGGLLERLPAEEAFDFRVQLLVLSKNVAEANGGISADERDAIVGVAQLLGLAAADTA